MDMQTVVAGELISPVEAAKAAGAASVAFVYGPCSGCRIFADAGNAGALGDPLGVWAEPHPTVCGSSLVWAAAGLATVQVDFESSRPGHHWRMAARTAIQAAVEGGLEAVAWDDQGTIHLVLAEAHVPGLRAWLASVAEARRTEARQAFLQEWDASLQVSLARNGSLLAYSPAGGWPRVFPAAESAEATWKAEE